MNQQIDTEDTPVTARMLKDAERMAALPRHFGRQGLRVEQSVYGVMDRLTKEYRGGYWEYYELSNGGFYMAPKTDEEFTFSVAGNGYGGRMSADAAGIAACLFVFSSLAFALNSVNPTACEKVAEHYHLLIDFARNHAEARKIFSAIN